MLLLNAYFSLSRAAWIPCLIAWNPETGEFRRVEGLEGFATWEEGDEAAYGARTPWQCSKWTRGAGSTGLGLIGLLPSW